MRKTLTIFALAIVNMLLINSLSEAQTRKILIGINVSGKVISHNSNSVSIANAVVKIFNLSPLSGRYELVRKVVTNSSGVYDFGTLNFEPNDKPRIGAYVNDIVEHEIHGQMQMDEMNEIGAYANDLNLDRIQILDPVIGATRDLDLVNNTSLNIHAIDETSTEDFGGGIGTYPRIPIGPNKYGVKQNFPNPFNPVTNISFELPEAAFVTLDVYDMSGKLVQQLVNETKARGVHTVTFDGSNLASGFYLYKISTADFSEIKKMSLVK